MNRRKPQKMTPAQKLAELTAYVDICFTLLSDYSWEETVALTGLSRSTLGRLHGHQFSLCVRFGTIQALGNAAGLKLVMTDYKARMKLAA